MPVFSSRIVDESMTRLTLSVVVIRLLLLCDKSCCVQSSVAVAER